MNLHLFFTANDLGILYILGNPEITLMFLSIGLDPKQKDSFGQVSFKKLVVAFSIFDVYLVAMQTPVHSACITGDLNCVELLAEHVRRQ